ncbi:BQ2448_3491 [Microbotryum intermedium]|uniref:BQ2448_3491 protein n=1 Tax=Microbotryum intermedium TaxID=269621 RepID=A0A238FD79_9BASI|nr:BQ2448_3491 [Microbotryum intermedium]
MLSSMLSRPKISVTLAQETVYVHPMCVDEPWQDSAPSREPIVSGTVLLSLPSAKAVNRIKVVLEGLCDAFGGYVSPYEKSTTMHKEVFVDLNGEVLPAGNHAFNFSFIIPSNTAVYQNCNFGRVRHFVKATACFTGALVGNITTPPVALFVVANPSRPGELPLPTIIDIQDINEHLGPVGIQINSPHLTVASLLSLRVALPSPPAPVEIKSINSSIHQTFEVHYTNGQIAKPPTQKHLLTKVSMKASPSLAVPICTTECGSDAPESSDELGPEPARRFLKRPLLLDPSHTPCCPPRPDVPELDPLPLKLLNGQEDEFIYHRMFRCPTDEYIRPTSIEESNNLIRVSHAIVVDIRYKRSGQPATEPDQVLTICKPISITSCCCLLDSLQLPVYTQNSPISILKPLKEVCLCTFTLEAMLDRDGRHCSERRRSRNPQARRGSFAATAPRSRRPTPSHLPMPLHSYHYPVRLLKTERCNSFRAVYHFGSGILGLYLSSQYK